LTISSTIRNLAGIFLVVLAALPAFSQSDLENIPQHLEKVVITAKQPLKEKGLVKTKIDTMVMLQCVNASLSDLLSNHTSLFIKSYGQGSLATASFRGTAASHTQVEWNGISINSPMVGQVDFSLIPVQFIDEIELLHGGSSLQEGSGGLGGSIRLESKPQWSKKLYGSVIQSIGSFGTFQSFVNLGGGSEKLQGRLRVFHEQSDNDFRFYNNAGSAEGFYDKQKNAGYSKDGLLGEINWNAGKGHFISLNAWIQQSNRNFAPIMSYQGLGREENQHDEELRFTGKWSKYWTRAKSYFVTGYTCTSMDYYLANQTYEGLMLNYNSHSNIRSLYNKYTYEIQPSERFLIRTILSYNHHAVSTFDQTEQNGYKATRNETGASVSTHYSFSSRLSAYALLREECNAGKFSPAMPSVGAEWQILKNIPLNLKTNLTRNYHQPTLNDLYWMPGGNPGLKPEKGYTADLSMDLHYFRLNTSDLYVSLTGYMSHITDWIIWQPSEFRYWTAQNLKTVFARGFEFVANGKYTMNNWTFSLNGNYSCTRTTNEGDKTTAGDDSKGKQLIYIPLHKANVLFTTDYAHFYASYMITYTSRRYTSTSNEEVRHQLPEYWLHNISVGKRFAFNRIHADLQFRINNLSDINYQAILSRAMSKRSYSLFLKVSF
jgi:outer membrane cobalamin receptor